MKPSYNDRMTALSLRSPVKAGFTIGGLSGVLFGTYTALQNDSAFGGALAGIFFAVFFGGMMAIFNFIIVNRSLNGMTAAQRSTVSNIVFQEAPIEDPALAPGVIRYADEIIRQTSGAMTKVGNVFITFIGPLAGFVFLMNEISDRDWSGVVAWSAIVATYIALIFRMPKQTRERARKAQSAKARAQELMGRSA